MFNLSARVAAVVEPVELLSLVMSRRMMRGIRQRAEQRSFERCNAD